MISEEFEDVGKAPGGGNHSMIGMSWGNKNRAWGNDQNEPQSREIPFDFIYDAYADRPRTFIGQSSGRPYTEMEALMSAAPHYEPEVAQESLFELRELLADTWDEVLTDKERWVLEAVVFRRLPVREAAAEIGIGKSTLCRIRDMALLKLRTALVGASLVEDHLDPNVGPKSWQEAAARAARILSQHLIVEDQKSTEYLLARARKLIDEQGYPYFNGRQSEFGYRSHAADEVSRFVQIGSIGMNGVKRTSGQSLDDIVRLITRKQRDYGHKNVAQFGTAGLVVRLSDKHARLENLLRRGVEPENESVGDSWADMVGYSLLGLMWVDGSFMLDLEEAA